MTAAEKLALALADGTLRTDPIRVLMSRHQVGEHAVREARKAAGIAVKVGGSKPSHGLLYGLHGPVKVAIVRNAVRALVGADRIERVAMRYGLTAGDVERVWGEPRRPPQQPPKPRKSKKRAPPQPDPVIVAQEAPAPACQPEPVPIQAVYDGEGDRLVPGTRVRYDAVALMWTEHKNGMRPLRTVAGRLGLTVAQVRECVRG